MKSFRARIIVWTLGITAVVLLGFGVASTVAFYRLKMQGVDEYLRLTIHPRLAPPRSASYWERYLSHVGPESERRVGAKPVILVYSKDEALEVGDWS